MQERRKTVIPELITKLETQITRADMAERRYWEVMNRIQAVDAAPRNETPILFPQTIEEMIIHSTQWLERVNTRLEANNIRLESLV